MADTSQGLHSIRIHDQRSSYILGSLRKADTLCSILCLRCLMRLMFKVKRVTLDGSNFYTRCKGYDASTYDNKSHCSSRCRLLRFHCDRCIIESALLEHAKLPCYSNKASIILESPWLLTKQKTIAPNISGRKLQNWTTCIRNVKKRSVKTRCISQIKNRAKPTRCCAALVERIPNAGT